MQPELYGRRTIVSATVTRAALPGLTRRLHGLLGTTINGGYEDKVLLPAGTWSFALGRAHAQAGEGVFIDVVIENIHTVDTSEGVYLASLPARFGAYFGWVSPAGVRVECKTLRDDYRVSVTYNLNPEEDERPKLKLIGALLEAGSATFASALTAAAAEMFTYDEVELTQPPSQSVELQPSGRDLSELLAQVEQDLAVGEE